MSGTQRSDPPADGGPRRAGVPGRLDRQPRRRHSDDVLEHRYRRPRHHLSLGEWRDRLWPGRAEGHEDLNLVNAGGQNVTLKPGAAVVHHADSFGIIRGGHIDVTVMGAYQVSMQRRFRQLEIEGPEGRRHRRRDGSRGMRQARVHHPGAHDTRRQFPPGAAMRLPVTARGVVKLVATNYGLFEPTGDGFRFARSRLALPWTRCTRRSAAG